MVAAPIVAEPTIEACDVGVLHRFAGPDLLRPDTVSVRRLVESQAGER